MHYLLSTLKGTGCRVEPKNKILDFGCGNGTIVHKLRAEGYDVVGCDIKFKDGAHVEELEKKGFISKIRMPDYRLPYEDETFDYILSETVFEHVQNTEETLSELHRILKTGGFALHLFPAKYGVIESHVHLPFASVIKSYPYLLFWALLGFRKKSQQGLSPFEVAKQNKKYLDTSTKYLSTREIKKAFSEKFSDVRFVENIAIRNSPTRLTVILSKTFSFVPFLPFLYRTFKSVAILTRK